MSKRFLLLSLTLLLTTSAFAQRVNYQALVNRSQAPAIFVNEMILPGQNGKTTLAFTFRFNNDFLSFKKLSFNENLNAPDDAEFYTTIRLNSEIFKGNRKDKLASMKAASRDVWADTLFAKSFDETQSKKHFAAGSMSAQLEPGQYNFVLQLTMMQETNERSTQRQNILIENLSDKETGEIFLIKGVQQSNEGQKLQLINMDQNVPFGRDFYALIRIPQYANASEYTLEVNEVRAERKDTTAIKQIYSETLNSQNIFTNSTVSLLGGNSPSLILSQGGHPYTYALVKVPNETFENAAYRISILKSGNESPLASEFFRSHWPDMPASLYNLDIALNNLRFIISDKELDQLKKGNAQEKKEKFQQFWESKDPTPGTVFNELMSEYYRRIDYAFKEFRSEEHPKGHESDQGKVYIKYGPPDNKERLFPTDDKVREIWTYGNKKFVFETGSGFGDFVLLGSK